MKKKMSVIITYTLVITLLLIDFLTDILSHTHKYTHSAGLGGVVFERIRLLAVVELITV